MEKSMKLNLVTPTAMRLEKDIVSLEVRTDGGVNSYFPDKENTVMMIMPCVMAARDSEGNVLLAALDGGVLIKRERKIKISAGQAVVGTNRQELEKIVTECYSKTENLDRNLQRTILELENELFRSFSGQVSR